MNRFKFLYDQARKRVGNLVYFKPISKRDQRKKSFNPDVPDLYVMVDSEEFMSLLDRAKRSVGEDGYVKQGVYGTYTVRRGPNTIQLWEQLYDSGGADQHWWMKVRGPAFDDEDLFPVESYRLTERRMTRALGRMTS